jgi:uncharacterized membrane protein YkoI
MKSTFSLCSRSALALAAFAAIGPVRAVAQTGDCLTDWAAASVIVKAHDLASFADVTRMAASKLGGDIVRSALCETPTGHVYRLIIRDARGQLTTVTVDAAHPFSR